MGVWEKLHVYNICVCSRRVILEVREFQKGREGRREWGMRQLHVAYLYIQVNEKFFELKRDI